MKAAPAAAEAGSAREAGLEERLPSSSPSLDDALDAALLRRSLLEKHRAKARTKGRDADWWRARPAAQPFPGIFNVGATCYLNALLQCLLSLDDVRAAVYAFRHDPAVHGPAELCVPLQLGLLFARMERTRQRAVDVQPLIASFGWRRADVYQQHDVQELCRVLFDCLSKFGVPLEERLFRGRLQSTLRCDKCGHTHARAEAFADVPLCVEGVASIEDAIAACVAPETLDGGDAGTAPPATRVAATKRVRSPSCRRCSCCS